jgi:8-oxo-dGTP pyrophosphatase MutT (NUDIX family)
MSLPIRIAAAVIRDRHGRVLLVRKRGTTAFMQPGGKINPGEDPLAALAREVREELACGVRPGSSRFLGRFAAAAANEAGETVLADLYAVEVDGNARAAAEIEEVAWVHPAGPHGYPLAPLTRDHVMPLLLSARPGPEAVTAASSAGQMPPTPRREK